LLSPDPIISIFDAKSTIPPLSFALRPGSSMVEHSTFNHKTVGSKPVPDAGKTVNGEKVLL
jgi:hypothetical protein